MASEADNVIFVSASACHIGGPIYVNPGELALAYGMHFIRKSVHVEILRRFIRVQTPLEFKGKIFFLNITLTSHNVIGKDISSGSFETEKHWLAV